MESWVSGLLFFFLSLACISLLVVVCIYAAFVMWI